MDLDNLQFDSDEERRKYLADLARLKRIREESRNDKNITTDDELFDDYRETQSLDNPNVIYRDRIVYVDRPTEDSHIDSSVENNYEQPRSRKASETTNASPKKDRKDSKAKKASKTTKTKTRFNPDKCEYETYEVEEEEPKKKSKWWLWVLLALLLLIPGYFVYAMFLSPKATGMYTVAVFGVDSRDGNVDRALTDVNILVQVNHDTGDIKLVSVYRDTYLQIKPDDYYHKMNEAYYKGGPEQAIWTLENNLDVKIDDYATFNWKAVVDTINILGGIDIEITDAEYKYINGFITETVNSTGVGSVQLEGPGYQHLDGVQAVAYARLRLMDTDFQRTERQRKVISLCFEKAKQADFATLNCILETVLPQISTSVTLDDMIPLAKNVGNFNIKETCGWPFDKVCQNIGKRGNCVIPVTLESNVIALQALLYPDKAYTPSEFIKKASAHIAEISGQYGSGQTQVTTDSGEKSEPSPQAAPVVEETQSQAAETPADVVSDESAVPSEDVLESVIEDLEVPSEPIEIGPGVEAEIPELEQPDDIVVLHE